MKDSFNSLMVKYGDNQSVTKLLKKLQSDFSPAHKKTLEHAICLAYYFYVQSDDMSTKKIVEVMAEFPFDGDYDHWVWVRDALALYARISRLEGDVIKNEQLVNKIWSAFEFGDQGKQRINRKIFMRRLNGANIAFDKIKASIDNGDVISETNCRFSCLREMVLIREVGASESYSIENAEKDIEANVEAIKKLLCSINIKEILPFSDV